MNLTTEQQQAIVSGEAVEAAVNGVTCVVLRKDIYERVKRVLYDDSEMDPRETYEAVLQAWDDQGSPEDGELYRDLLQDEQ